MTARPPNIGIFAKILSETPEQRHQRISGIYKASGGKPVVVLANTNPDPQSHQAWYRPTVATEMR